MVARVLKLLAKRADEGFYGQITVEFQDGTPVLVRETRQRKPDKPNEMDGCGEARLQELLTIQLPE